MKELSPKQKNFCDEYMIGHNGSAAAIKAGYSKKTARIQSSQLLTKLNIKAYIASKQHKVEEKFEIRLEDVLKRVQSHAIDGDNTTIQLKAEDMLLKHLGAYTEKLEIHARQEVHFYAPKKDKTL